MKRTIIVTISICFILLLYSSCRRYQEVLYTFDNIPDRIWIGEDFWTVPLEGWQVKNGRIECKSHIQQATFSILPYVLTERTDGFRVTFDIGLLEKGNHEGSAGVIIGMEALEEKDVRAAVYFGQGVNMGVNTAGYAFIEQNTIQLPPDFDFEGFKIEVKGSGSSGGYDLTMNVMDMEGNILSELSYHSENSLSGIIQLVNNFRTASSADNGPKFWFDNLNLEGKKFAEHDSNRFGPVLWTMHTLSRNTLKMTAQLPPVSESENQVAELQVKRDGNWHTLSTGEMDPNEAYCIAEEGKQYALYFPDGGDVMLDLSAVEGELKLRWMSIGQSSWFKTETIQGHEQVKISTPGRGQWAALIQPIKKFNI